MGSDDWGSGQRGQRPGHCFPAVQQQWKAAELEWLKPNVRARCLWWSGERSDALTTQAHP